MKGFCPLASGSKGNALYLGSDHTKLLIDVGISFKMLERRLEEIGVGLDEIDAVVISHEHSDHIKGLEKLCSSFDIPVLTNSETAKAIVKELKKPVRFKIFSTGEPFEFGDIQVTPFSVQHDTVDPVAFTFMVDKVKVGVCTDLGFVSSLVKKKLMHCHYLYIEANHEPSMVYACARPEIYKRRVLGNQGHLSNEMCAALLKEIAHQDLKYVYLAHLSSECNHPEVALKKARAALGEATKISIAYQDRISQQIFF